MKRGDLQRRRNLPREGAASLSVTFLSPSERWGLFNLLIFLGSSSSMLLLVGERRAFTFSSVMARCETVLSLLWSTPPWSDWFDILKQSNAEGSLLEYKKLLNQKASDPWLIMTKKFFVPNCPLHCSSVQICTRNFSLQLMTMTILYLSSQTVHSTVAQYKYVRWNFSAIDDFNQMFFYSQTVHST